MAANAFTILCCLQMSVGALMVIFGIVDRTSIQIQFSFMMLPIWIGIAAAAVGFIGLLFGIQNTRQGSVNLTTAPFMKAVNAMTVGLSLMALLLYGTTLSYIGLRIDYNIAYNNLPDDDPNKNKYHIMGKQLTPVDVNADDDMLQGIMGTICFLSLVEMFLGSFMILLDTECMFVRGSQAAGRQRLVPVSNVANEYRPPPTQSAPTQDEQLKLANMSSEQT